MAVRAVGKSKDFGAWRSPWISLAGGQPLYTLNAALQQQFGGFKSGGVEVHNPSEALGRAIEVILENLTIGDVVRYSDLRPNAIGYGPSAGEGQRPA